LRFSFSPRPPQTRGGENVQETLPDHQTLPGVVLAGVEAHVRFGREHLQQRVPDEVQKLRQTRVRGAHGVLLEPGTEPGGLGERVPGELREGKGPDDVRFRRQRVP